MKNKFFIPALFTLVVLCFIVQLSVEFPQPVFSVELVSLAPGEGHRLENGEIVAQACVKRLGRAGTCRLVFLVDGERHEEEFKVRGRSRNFYFTRTFPAGWHKLELENKSFEVYVMPAEVSENAEVEIRSFEIEPMDAKLWEIAFVKVRLKNHSDVAGWKTVRVWVENTPMEKKVLVPAGAIVDTYFPIELNKVLLRVWVENCPQPAENLRPGIL